MTKAIIYTRVSTSEQGESGLGLDAQAAICKDYCARNHLEIVEVTTEVQSGKSTRRRPVLASALETLRKGDADVLIASNVSRLSRSIGDLVGLISEADKRGYSVVALDTGLDTSTPAGRMVFQMLGVAAEYERAMTSDRTKKALARAKAKGTQLGRRTSLPDGVVERIAAERASGRTLAAIASDLNSEQVATGQGGAKWYPATISKVLSRVS
jgi:DNA invertase Pin-like site-specific DNA recombinase